MADSGKADVRQVLYPFATDATSKVQKQGGRFAYYTSADTAYRIIKNREVWMRSTRTMNDFMEVEHGIDCVRGALGSNEGKQFADAINAHFPNLFDEVRHLYTAWIPGFQADTFVTCVSEHAPVDDQYGRLSMWRAYGGRAGVALVLNGGAMFRESHALPAYSSPVAYADVPGIAAQFARVSTLVAGHADVVQGLGREGLRDHLFNMLRLATVCTKHPGFEEEREWRIVASPAIESSDLLPSAIEVVGGIPQAVLKIRLEDHPEQGLVGLALPALLDRVLIGPTEYPSVIRRALISLLNEAGVDRPADKVFVSDIPLREAQR